LHSTNLTILLDNHTGNTLRFSQNITNLSMSKEAKTVPHGLGHGKCVRTEVL